MAPPKVFLTHSADETTALGRQLAQRLSAPVLILVSGELGAGKTTLAKGIVAGLGAAREEEVTSPTFTLVHVFTPAAPEGGGQPATAGGEVHRVYHVDLYRVDDAHDLETLGLEDIFTQRGVVIVEWPERLAMHTGWPVMRVRLLHAGDDVRRIEVTTAG